MKGGAERGRGAEPAPIRVLVVDDEPVAREHVRRLLAGDPEVEVVGDCGNGRDAVAAVRAQSPDLVLLDIQMPELDGFGVIREVGVDRMPLVVFTTAYDDYALEAFRVHALDYLLKPIDAACLAGAVARAKPQLRAAAAARTEAGGGAAAAAAEQLAALLRHLEAREVPAAAGHRIAIKVDGRLIFLRADQIDWVEAVDDYVRLHVARQEFVVRETLTHLEARLPRSQFLRVHRSTLVNVDRIREVQPWFQGNYVLILADGRRLTSGRSYRPAVQRFLNDAM